MSDMPAILTHVLHDETSSMPGPSFHIEIHDADGEMALEDTMSMHAIEIVARSTIPGPLNALCRAIVDTPPADWPSLIGMRFD